MDRTSGRLREEVIGDSVKNGKYVMAAVGMGFIGAFLGFVPLVGILLGLMAIVLAYFVLKTGISKFAAYVLGASAIAASIAATLWGESAQANAISSDFTAQTGVWKLFGYSMMPLDYVNQWLFAKSPNQTWNAKNGVVFASSVTAQSSAATGATSQATSSCPGCGAV